VTVRVGDYQHFLGQVLDARILCGLVVKQRVNCNRTHIVHAPWKQRPARNFGNVANAKDKQGVQPPANPTPQHSANHLEDRPPVMPDPSECCGNSCRDCVFVQYWEQVGACVGGLRAPVACCDLLQLQAYEKAREMHDVMVPDDGKTSSQKGEGSDMPAAIAS
jgi:hypothetical protein